MNYEKISGESYEVFLANNIDSQVKVFVAIDDFSIDKLNDNQCVIVVKQEKMGDILNIVHEVEKMIMQRKRKMIDSNVVILSNEAIDVQNFDDDDIKFTVQSEEYMKNANGVDNVLKEEKEEEPFEKFWSVNVIKKEDNGLLKSYIQRKGDSGHVGYLVDMDYLRKEDLFYEFQEKINDPFFKESIESLSQEDVANLLLDSIVEKRNIKTYKMETNEKQSSFDTRGSIASSVAATNDGVVNTELGIIHNSPNSSTMINAVEENNGNHKVIAPEVMSDGNSLNNGDGTYLSDVSEQYSSSLNNDSNENNNELTEDEERIQKRANTRRLVRTPPYQNHSSGFVSVVGISVIFIILFLFILFIVN